MPNKCSASVAANETSISQVLLVIHSSFVIIFDCLRSLCRLTSLITTLLLPSALALVHQVAADRTLALQT